MNAVLATVMLAALALLAGAFALWRKGAPRLQISLMVVLAVVMLGNVLIWTLPNSNGEAPLDQAEALGR